MRSAKYVACPYCGEDILASARKCKHCGEWLDGPSSKGNDSSRGSADARAVTKGLKQKEQDEAVYKVFIFLSIVLGVIVWSASKDFWWGFMAFVVGGLLSAWWYHRE